MSVMSRGVLGSHATAALQVMLFPLVAFNWLSTEAGTTLAMFRLISELELDNRNLRPVANMTSSYRSYTISKIKRLKSLTQTKV